MGLPHCGICFYKGIPSASGRTGGVLTARLICNRNYIEEVARLVPSVVTIDGFSTVELRQMASQVDALKDQLRYSQSLVAEKEAEVASLREALSEARAEAEASRDSGARLHEDAVTLRGQLAQLREENQVLKHASAQAAVLERELKAMRAYITSVGGGSESSSLPKKNSTLEAQVSALREVLSIQDGLALSAGQDERYDAGCRNW